jgi:hypothetical protein
LLGNPTNLTHWATRALQSKWAWSKRYYWHLKVRFLLWPSPWNRQQIKNKNKTNNKRDDFTFPIVNFPFISRNIPASPAYGVYISQCRRYSRVCASIMIIWAVFRYWNTAFQKARLKSSLQKLYGRHYNLVYCDEISISQIIMGLFLSE